MLSTPAVPALKAAVPARRTWLVGCLTALTALRAAGQDTPASAPRLRFRTRRAVCDCAGEVDEETIERALAERAGPVASGPAARRDVKPATTSKQNPTTTRRPAP